MPERNTLRQADAAPAADPVLDAARATVLDFGVRRATLTEVARRAGLSRMTVYRRYADGNELMRALMSKEFGAVLDEVQLELEALPDPRDRVVRAAVGTVRRLVEHPLLLRLLELEPEMILPYLTERVGEFQRSARAALARLIAQAQAEGRSREGDPEVLSDAIETAARGLVLSAPALHPDERERQLEQLEAMLDAYLDSPGS